MQRKGSVERVADRGQSFGQGPCQLNEKSLIDTFPLKKADGVQVAKGVRERRKLSLVFFFLH
jgi:hypothetical protein